MCLMVDTHQEYDDVTTVSLQQGSVRKRLNHKIYVTKCTQKRQETVCTPRRHLESTSIELAVGQAKRRNQRPDVQQLL